ncbi:Caspase domain protein [Aspergillus parasiticus SU-1]|uniref:Caspase domain protein n=1 Tax=Aspergillus parasiticus (strain ATCC 56775 / NRRL 5862 / SRRC 143 / SU-1) TaxID=1403190 RepID=A0A0F0IL01_ASPPU|nr:Caspase domain protein [Aspergillus parasiticus SU-1]
MPSNKRALLIASTYGGLNGTLNDVKTMEGLLTKRDFEIIPCYNENATRAGILEAWNSLIESTSPGDAVVIYYSGHGALVHDEKRKEKNKSWQFQFLVPVDYDESNEGDFRGILDVEISYLLRDTTDKTRNVTIVIDCCHSGRMFRDPDDEPVKHKSLSKVQFHDLNLYLKQLREKGYFHGEVFQLGNPYAVRIAAAATSESACEHINARGQWSGALTDALAKAMAETDGIDVSWRTTLVRVCQLVNTRHQWQHPQVEGPDTRAHFSLQHVKSGALYVKIENGKAMIDAGSVVGVRKGNVYTVVPFNPDEAEEGEPVVEATVTAVAAFKSKATLTHIPSWRSIHREGALAFLKRDVVEKLPVSLPSGLDGLQAGVEESRYLKPSSPDDNHAPLAEFRHEEGSIVLVDHQGVRIRTRAIDSTEEGTSQAFSDIIADAERLARAKRVRELRCERRQDLLAHNLQVTVGTVEVGEPKVNFQMAGNDRITEGESVYIRLENGGSTTLYVSVLNINVVGTVSSLTGAWPLGIELPAELDITLGSNSFDELVGSKLSWPTGVATDLPVEERFVILVSNRPVSLNYLVESVNLDIDNLRDAAEFVKTAAHLYDVVHVPFRLHAKGSDLDDVPDLDDDSSSETVFYDALDELPDQCLLAANLPEPEMVVEWADALSYPLDSVPKGIFGAILRTSKNIPPCIRVINQHTEEITVVVSKYRPNRMLSDVGINASATGAGINFSTTTFNGPATKKTLASQTDECGCCVATFPLWSRSEGFGVISIFKGPEKVLYIENDRVPAGATAYFANKPNLRLEKYAAGQQWV